MAEETGRLLGWTVCANISDHLRAGRDPEKFYQGTRIFSPGAKVYVSNNIHWGEGAARLHVIGLHRMSRKFVNGGVGIGILEDIRTASIYAPKLWGTLKRLGVESFETPEDAEKLSQTLALIAAEERPEKLQPEERHGFFRKATVEKYRTAKDKGS